MFEALISLGYATIPPLSTSPYAIFRGIAAIILIGDAPVVFRAALEVWLATICARSTFISGPDVDLGNTSLLFLDGRSFRRAPVIRETLEVSRAMAPLFIVMVLHSKEILDLQSPDLTPVLGGSELNTLAVFVVPAPLLAVLQAVRSDDWDLAPGVSILVLFLRRIMAAHRVRTFADKIQTEGFSDVGLRNQAELFSIVRFWQRAEDPI